MERVIQENVDATVGLQQEPVPVKTDIGRTD